MINLSRILLSGCALLSLEAAASPVIAQNGAAAPDTTAPSGNSEDTAILQEIIVTATRSAQTDLQKTPIAVTAFNPQALADRGVSTALDLNGLAPNVSIGGRSGTGATQGAVTIRGLGVDANPPASPAVGIYVDDVYIPSAFGNLLGTYDLAQLEILRGPQGTLFGRNTIGGALQYTGVKPKIGDLSAFAEATLGNMKHRDFLGGVNLPLADWAALRISGATTKIDGFVRDLRNDVNRGSEHNSDIRAQLRLQPSSDLLIDIKAEQITQRSNGPSATQLFFWPQSITYTPALRAFVSPDYYTTFGPNQPNDFRSKLKIAQAVVSYTITPELQVKSITAYSKNTDRFRSDTDGTPISAFANSRGDDVNKLFTQELQLSGKTFDGRLHFTMGAFYYAENSSNSNATASFFGSPFANTVFGDYTVKTKSYAGYGQLTYDITDRLSLLGGLRYTRDDVDVVDVRGVNTPISPLHAAPYSRSANFDNWSPLVGVNYQASDDMLFYAKWSRGFRAGGFSPNLYSANPFGQETAETYEAGLRLELFDHRVRFNPTVFRTSWKNIQFNANALTAGGPAPVIQNAGNARSKGLELETQFAVTPRLMVNANGALFEGHYTYIGPGLLAIPRVGPPALTYDTPLKRAPKSSFSIGGRYDLPVGEGKVSLSGNYAWQAHQRSATTDVDNLEIKSYGLLNMRLKYSSPRDAYSISLYANNLADVKYAIGGTKFGQGGGPIPETERDVGRPREVGVTVRVNLAKR